MHLRLYRSYPSPEDNSREDGPGHHTETIKSDTGMGCEKSSQGIEDRTKYVPNIVKFTDDVHGKNLRFEE